MGGISLEEIKKENVDLEKVSIEEVFESLKCSREGLTSEEGANRIQLFGPNKLEEKNESKILKFLGFMWNPLSWVMEAAAIMAIALANGGGAPPDWQDFVGIVVLLVINSTISFIEENNAGNAAAALMANLAPKTKLLRDGRWSEQEAALLVPGDIISVKLGDIIPPMLNPYDEVFSGSTCKQGEIEAVVIATGVHTFFGKAAHLVDSTNQIISIAIGIVIEIIVMYPIQRRPYRNGINNLPVLLIGGIPHCYALCFVVTMAIGSHKLSQQRWLVWMCSGSDKTGTLTLNKLFVDKTLIEVFAKGVEKDHVILFAARASGTENQDAIDLAILHFFPFNPVDKRTALTYTDSDGKWHRVSKGAPEQILALCNAKEDLKRKVHSVIDKFGGCRRKARKVRGPVAFVGLLALFDPPGHDSAKLSAGALHLGVNETGRRLGMGSNMYPSSSLLGDHKDESIGSIPVDELIEKADGFAGVFQEHKYEIVKRLRDMKHIVGMTGDGILVLLLLDATIFARSASDIVLTEPGLSVIISAVLTSRTIFQRMKNYTIYAVSITIRIVLGFLLIALIWKFDFSPFMVLIIAILNDGTIMTISKDRVTPSPPPDSWKLKEIFATGVVLGTYMALATVLFFRLMSGTTFFETRFHVRTISTSNNEMIWSFLERPGVLLVSAFLLAQLVATLIAVYAIWSFALIQGCGWGWAGVIWLYSIVTYVPLDILKFAIRYVLSGKAWNNLIDNKTAFTTKKDFGKEEREAQWATAQRTLHGLQPQATTDFIAAASYAELSEIAELAKKRAEVARLRQGNTLKGNI
ncbi:hypothetical protein NE237_005124 [Protea cynaroides]|uniref:Cation-transporting P-type ATPase N-terminal domain-containing protein n=1 Tax=Protea cynaroides TaxID=273540 RepID=A0A9Q0QTZ3_9MAGN|nr:hypothetical protein NE237_005124 [Protea cynaroides]